MSGTWQTVVGLLGTLGAMSTAVVALLHSRRNGRKIDADTVSVLTNATITLVKPLEERVGGLGLEVAHLREHINERDRLVAEHSGWDYIVEEKARDAGISLPPRPPLQPSRPLLSLAQLERQARAAGDE